MSAAIKILGVHGLGDHRNSTWEHDWEQAVRRVFPGQTDMDLEFSFVNYDAIFADTDISGWETMRAVWKLDAALSAQRCSVARARSETFQTG